MNDFSTLEKTIVRELSCRLCLCSDVVKLKPLSTETKRKIKGLFNIVIRTDDNLPKAICHDCLQQISAMYLYTVKVEKTQKFLDFHKMKNEQKEHTDLVTERKLHPIIKALSTHNIQSEEQSVTTPKSKSNTSEHKRNVVNSGKFKESRKKSRLEMRFMEAMPLEEFATTEHVDASLLINPTTVTNNSQLNATLKKINTKIKIGNENDACNILDSIVLIDGKPAKEGAELDKQISLFYKMECCICHSREYDFRSLIRHYKERHGVPGYVTCCDKKFHYFYPKKIIEHMAYHLQPNIFMCPSCHTNFQTSEELLEHENNGGRSEGKITCPRCTERYPTYRELGHHIGSHRTDKSQCDYCGKVLKHHHRKKTVNHMEDMILCSQCLRTLKNMEKQGKETKEKVDSKCSDATRSRRFYKALDISEDASTE